MKAYSTATVTGTTWSWWKDRNIGHWDIVESPEVESDKYAEIIQWRKDCLFNK